MKLVDTVHMVQFDVASHAITYHVRVILSAHPVTLNLIIFMLVGTYLQSC